jgi:thiosulfate/3-mercaptopyruvate sulfurtransferase
MANPLISASDLHTRLGEPDIVIIDSRWYIDDPDAGRVAYDEAHIPGAMFAHLDEDLATPDGPGRHPLPDHHAFGAFCGRVGINATTHVVVYDDRGGGIAARLWWMLRNQGHTSVSVLDGGLDAWHGNDGPLTDVVPHVEPERFSTRPWTGTVDLTDVVHRSSETILTDARALERYRGDEEPIDPVAGHIPGAVPMPLTDNLNTDMTFMAPADLRDRFMAAGIDGSRPVMAHCGSGVTACHNILAMVIAGMPMADLYVGSWSDWSTAGMPAATGDDPV